MRNTKAKKASAAKVQPVSTWEQNPRYNGMPMLRARFDVAQTTPDNRKHWAMADGFSANAALLPDVLRTLRIRSRYECQNNSYAAGIACTLANDTIGTGPRLQMLTDDDALNTRVEAMWNTWASRIKLTQKLRKMRHAKFVDGESFALITNNPRLPGNIKLDIRVIEADQVATPDLSWVQPFRTDGVQFDQWGNVLAYTVLQSHPGDLVPNKGGWSLKYDVVPAKDVIQWGNLVRPDQYRGIPEITPALPLFAELRRYTAAVIAAAEFAASQAGVLYTDSPANGEAEPGSPFESLDFERRMITSLPDGWNFKQFQAEQPTTTYGEFKGQILKEIFRCFLMPFNIGAGDSSGYNYSSGMLDHQGYFRKIDIERDDAEAIVVDRLFAQFLREGSLIEGSNGLPQSLRSNRDELPPHQWMWPAHGRIDPEKEAIAQQIRIKSGTTTLAAECARDGNDWEQIMRQRAKERKLAVEVLGLNDPFADAGTPAGPGRPANKETADA